MGTWGSIASDHERMATMHRHDRQVRDPERIFYPVSWERQSSYPGRNVWPLHC